MQFSYDKAKNTSNKQKHGVALSEAEFLEWDLLISTQDVRRDYGEIRHIGFAPIDDRLYCIVFTDRGDTRHIISLRKANNREKAYYASNY